MGEKKVTRRRLRIFAERFSQFQHQDVLLGDGNATNETDAAVQHVWRHLRRSNKERQIVLFWRLPRHAHPDDRAHERATSYTKRAQRRLWAALQATASGGRRPRDA